MKTLILIVCCMALSGCGHVEYAGFSEWTFLKEPAIKTAQVEMTKPNGTKVKISIKGFGSPVSEGAEAALEGVAAGLKVAK